MIKRSRWIPVLLILLFLSMWVGQTSQTKCSAATPQKTVVPALLAINTFSGDKSLPNGIEVYSGKAILQVVALRERRCPDRCSIKLALVLLPSAGQSSRTKVCVYWVD